MSADLTNTIRLATRESALAMWQANHVKAALEAAHPELTVVIVGMTTEGDRNKQSPLSQIGGKGVFVKELETALLDGSADIAVHSMKDVPAELPDGLQITAICEREDPRDAFVSNQFDLPGSMPAGARVGSSSLRRRLQFQDACPELDYLDLRGNVDTRLRKLDEGEYEAIVLACAGLIRLGLGDRIRHPIDVSASIPAAGQGAVGIESRASDERVNGYLAAINHHETSVCVRCERQISIGLGASCNLPIAAHAVLEDGMIRLMAYIASTDGNKVIKVEDTAEEANAMTMAQAMVQKMLDQGAGELIETPHIDTNG